MTWTVSLLTVMFAAPPAPPAPIRTGSLAPGSGQNPVV